jgi:hypothetical protein
VSELVSSMTEYWLSASSKGVIVPSGFSPIGLSNSSLEKEIKEREKKSIHQHHTHTPPPTQIHVLFKKKSLKTKVFSLKLSLCVTGKMKGA